MQFDIAICGAGPAGAALALKLLQKNYSVLLLDRSRFDKWRIGEVLAPEVRPYFNDLGLDDVVRSVPHMEIHDTVSNWGGSIEEKNHILNPYGHGWIVDRTAFDSALAVHCGSQGARFLRGVGIAALNYAAESGWELRLSNDERVRCGFLVDATGRNARIAKRLGFGRNFVDRSVSISAMASLRGRDNPPPTLWVEALRDGWLYFCPVPFNNAVCSFITDGAGRSTGGAKAVFLRAMDTSFYIKDRMAEYVIDTVRLFPADVSYTSAFCGPGWLAVGDAVYSNDPLSGLGIQKGLQTAFKAAESVQQFFQENPNWHSGYADWIKQSFLGHLRQRAEIYQLEQRWPAAPYWQARMNAGSQKRVEAAANAAS